MTEPDVLATIGTIKSLWPATFKRSADEWSVFAERAAIIPIEHAQAYRALRQLKATSEKYPTVAGLLKALGTAVPTATTRKPEERADEPESVEYMLTRWRRMLGLAGDTPRGQIVRDWWLDSFARSVRLRGCVKEKFINDAHRDLIEIAGMSPDEADQWVYETEARAAEYAKAIDNKFTRARWGRMEAMDKSRLPRVSMLQDGRAPKANPGLQRTEAIETLRRVTA